MILILPAAKTLDFDTVPRTLRFTQPEFLKEAQLLVKELRRLDPSQLALRMAISDKLAKQTFGYYESWRPPFMPGNAKQALLAYAGDLYTSLDAASLDEAVLIHAQERLRILSGLYGLLRPLDLMQPYRLEMGARLAPKGHRNLYGFWGQKITDALNKLLDGETQAGREPVLLNLASEEYAKVVQPGRLRGRMITPIFQDGQAERFKVVSYFAKRARGSMARSVLGKRVILPEKLRHFSQDGYHFVKEASGPDRWIFRREVS